MRTISLLSLAAVLFILTACAATTAGTNDDATISTRVKIALLGDPQTQLLRLDVRTFQGVVTLSGTAPSAAVEQRAIAVARKTKGVKDVKNEITVSDRPSLAVHHSAVVLRHSALSSPFRHSAFSIQR